MLRVALCVICHERPQELRDALASAEGRGFDEIVVLDMASDPPLAPVEGTRHLRSEENLGVTVGRNRLLEATGADLLVFLDDDAVLRTDAAGQVRAIFEADPRLGAVAFRVVRADGRTESSEYPFRGSADGTGDARPCTYFVGCGYAARRDAVLDVGGYDERFFYSTEEVDLGFRLLRRSWRLVYDPSIVVEHRPSSRGRSVAPRVPALRLRNRLVLVRRYLPLPIAVLHAGAWGLRTLGEARAADGVKVWAGAWREGLREPVDRRPLGWRQLLEIHRHGGRVLW